MAEHDFPVTLGRDYAGIVEYAGSDTIRHRAGDEVYGFVPATNPTVHDGSWAELIVVPESGWVARKPASIELEAAGASPLAGITALAALDALQPAEGETVLVIGATGGVGSFFVQLASIAGAHVVAPGLAEDADYLTGIGVGEILDRDADLATALDGRQVDAILDVVSFAPQETLLSAGTRLASSNGAAGEGPGRFNLYAQPSPENLERLAGLLDAGTLRVSIQESFELAQAGEALALPRGGSHPRQGRRQRRVAASISARRPPAPPAPAAASARPAPGPAPRRTAASAVATTAPGARHRRPGRTRIHAGAAPCGGERGVRRMVRVGQLGGGVGERTAAELGQLHRRLELHEEPVQLVARRRRRPPRPAR